MPDKKAAAKNFSQAAGTYHAHASAQALSADKLCWLIKKHVDTPIEKVADLGCGTGMLSRHLLETFPKAELSVVDIAPDMLTQCHEHLIQPPIRLSDPIKNLSENCQKGFRGSKDTGVPTSFWTGSKKIWFVQADIETEAWGTDFSLVASNYCLQWTNPTVALANIVPRLRRGGFFAFSVPCRGTFPELHAAIREVRKHKPQGLKYHSANAWTKMLRHAGLEVIQHDVFTTVLTFDSSALALRSFSKIGATFSRHADYKPLDRSQIIELLRIYDKKSGVTESLPYSRVTYKTLTVLCRTGY